MSKAMRLMKQIRISNKHGNKGIKYKIKLMNMKSR